MNKGDILSLDSAANYHGTSVTSAGWQSMEVGSRARGPRARSSRFMARGDEADFFKAGIAGGATYAAAEPW